MLFRCRLFFLNSTFLKNYFRNTIRVSNSLDPDQANKIPGLIWVQMVCKGYQQKTSIEISGQKKGVEICGTCILLSVCSRQRVIKVHISWDKVQGTKIFQYCTCPAGCVTYNFHSSCKHIHLSFKSLSNREHKGVICNMTYKVP